MAERTLVVNDTEYQVPTNVQRHSRANGWLVRFPAATTYFNDAIYGSTLNALEAASVYRDRNYIPPSARYFIKRREAKNKLRLTGMCGVYVSTVPGGVNVIAMVGQRALVEYWYIAHRNIERELDRALQWARRRRAEMEVEYMRLKW